MSARTLVLVTGSSRSGTSTMAGLLDALGLHVPGPYLKANPSNPKGFFESRRSVRFHNDALERAGVRINDDRLDAPGMVADAIGPKRRARLAQWLAQVAGDARVTVVKDPRLVWALPVWREVADGLGMRVGVVIMMRHPTAVLGSRATYYAQGDDSVRDADFVTSTLGGWLVATLAAERDSRGLARTVVRYDDLVADWRGAATAVRDGLGLAYDVPPAGSAHPGDDFVDPALRRHPTGWDGVPVPEQMRSLADDVWAAAPALDPAAFDLFRARYPR